MSIFILGMHRSGTSLAASFVESFGVFLGPAGEMHGPRRDNVHGFFERKDVVDLNQSIFADLGCDWDRIANWPDASRLTECELRHPRWKSSIAAVLRKLKTGRPWAVKDPRLSLTLPLWLGQVDSPLCILVYRNPVDTALSLFARDHVEVQYAIALWEKYVVSAWQHAGGLPCLPVNYDDLVGDTLAAGRSIYDFLQSAGTPGLEYDPDRVLALVDEKERHHCGSRNLGEHLTLHQGEIFRALKDGGESQLKEVMHISSAAESMLGQYEFHSRRLPGEGGMVDRSHTADSFRYLRGFRMPPLWMKLLRRAAKLPEALLPGPLKKYPRLPVDGAIVRRSGLFDRDFYLEVNGDVAASSISPLFHYLLFGREEGRKPSVYFDPDYYGERYPDTGGEDPFLHFILHGYREKRFGNRVEEQIVTGRETKVLPDQPYFSSPVPGGGGDDLREEPRLLTEEEARSLKKEGSVRLVAFYLPQFHPIRENDAWWGKGFTEWSNVTRATPLYEGHYQPHLPGDLGFYDLRVPEIMERQVDLARRAGIHGFCFHFYWFNGRRLLERPVETFLARKELDFPFCICWANENWTRKWDGVGHEVLISQEHSEAGDRALIDDLRPSFDDDRYIRVDGKPLFIVYRVDTLGKAGETAERWRDHCRKTGLGEIYLVAAQTFGMTDPRLYGFDAAVEFPPHNIRRSKTTMHHRLNMHYSRHRLTVYDMPEYLRAAAGQTFDYPLFRTAFPSWDNSPRVGLRALVCENCTPETYRRWLESNIEYARSASPHPIAFVNAWNEWAEGAHLEPDRRYGHAYLNATTDALRNTAVKKAPAVRP